MAKFMKDLKTAERLIDVFFCLLTITTIGGIIVLIALI